MILACDQRETGVCNQFQAVGMPLTPDALEEGYRRQGQALLIFFQRRVHDAQLAADLLAETFAVAIERRDQFRGTGEEQLSGWLWAIAQSLLREFERRDAIELRHVERVRLEHRELTEGEILRVEELAEQAELADLVRRGLDRLPPEQREAVTLRVLEDLTYSEIAKRLEVRPATARARVSRGLRALQGILGEPEEAEDGVADREPWG